MEITFSIQSYLTFAITIGKNDISTKTRIEKSPFLKDSMYKSQALTCFQYRNTFPNQKYVERSNKGGILKATEKEKERKRLQSPKF